MSVLTSEQATNLTEYQQRVATKRAHFDAVVNWHLLCLTEAGIELPYTPDDSWIYATVSEYDYEAKETVIDEDATVKYLAKVIQVATAHGYEVEKKYDDENFKVYVHIEKDYKAATGTVKVTYNASRNTVCTKTVVGTKIIPATTYPERVEEVVEWDCKKLSFLGIDTDSDES